MYVHRDLHKSHDGSKYGVALKVSSVKQIWHCFEGIFSFTTFLSCHHIPPSVLDIFTASILSVQIQFDSPSNGEHSMSSH